MHKTPRRDAGTSVAPLAGAWIEIDMLFPSVIEDFVAPLAGAWIEIIHKLVNAAQKVVAPLAGAWIEILTYD